MFKLYNYNYSHCQVDIHNIVSFKSCLCEFVHACVPLTISNSYLLPNLSIKCYYLF